MMKKSRENLFKIGEVTKIMGVTRKTLLVYENAGLLVPARKDEESGFRYYSVDNMTHIRSIRALQALGLTLKEVAEYYEDAENIDARLQRLIDLRSELDKTIRMLRVRAAKQGDLTVHKTTLPRQVCFVRRSQCKDVAEATAFLRSTYVAAVNTGKILSAERMFSMRMSQSTDKLDIMCCIPMESSYDGPERMEFAEEQALCIYYRGPYEGIGTAHLALLEYAKKYHIEITGPFRSTYLEGPPNRGDNREDYITLVTVPVSERV